MRIPIVQVAVAFAVACSAGGPLATSAGDGGGGAVSPPRDDGGVFQSPGTDAGVACADLCRCAERGPANDSLAGAGRPSATSSEDQRAALLRANRWRTSAGLPALDAHAQVEQAASSHARYLAQNLQAQCWPNAHEETATCTGFTGVRPGPRVFAAGYPYSLATEVINWKADIDTAVDTWIWTVYHRRSFFEWRLLHVGFGRSYGPYRSREAQHNVMNFAAPRAGGATRPHEPIVFPVPGQRDVPTSFQGDIEEPVPPTPAGGWPSGPVVSVHFPVSDWTVTAHRLLRAATCTDVPHTFATRDTDANLLARDSDEAFLYADVPLAPDAEWVVRIEGTVAGTPYARSWAFSTRP